MTDHRINASECFGDNLWSNLRAAVYLLNWLEDQNLTLATCRQTDLERWLTSDDIRHRREAGHFVRWALSQRIARDLSFPAVKWNGPSQAMDDEARWATARRLLHDDTSSPKTASPACCCSSTPSGPRRSPD